MAANYPNLDLGDSFIDLFVQPGYEALADTKVTIQNDSGEIRSWFGGASAPAVGQGNSLLLKKSVTGTASNLWLCGPGVISILQED